MPLSSAGEPKLNATLLDGVTVRRQRRRRRKKNYRQDNEKTHHESHATSAAGKQDYRPNQQAGLS